MANNQQNPQRRPNRSEMTIEEKEKYAREAGDAFLKSSRKMLDNNMANLSNYLVLSDAISAIKESFESYLYGRYVQRQTPIPQELEALISRSQLPEMMTACKQENLTISDTLEDHIVRLNKLRNRRTHGTPEIQVFFGTAQESIAVANEVRKLVRDTLRPQRPILPVSVPTAPAAPIAPKPSAPVAVANIPQASSTLPNSDISVSDDENIYDDYVDESDLSDDATPKKGRWRRVTRRVLRFIGRVAAVILLVLVGLAAGIGVMIPVATGNAPSWLSFATHLLPTPTPNVAPPTPIATAIPSGPVTLGTMEISVPICRGGSPSLVLHNIGTEAVAWAVASPGATVPLFTIGPVDTPQHALFGSLAADTSVIIYSAGQLPVVVTTPAGAVQLALPSC